MIRTFFCVINASAQLFLSFFKRLSVIRGAEICSIYPPQNKNQYLSSLFVSSHCSHKHLQVILFVPSIPVQYCRTQLFYQLLVQCSLCSLSSHLYQKYSYNVLFVLSLLILFLLFPIISRLSADYPPIISRLSPIVVLLGELPIISRLGRGHVRSVFRAARQRHSDLFHAALTQPSADVPRSHRRAGATTDWYVETWVQTCRCVCTMCTMCMGTMCVCVCTLHVRICVCVRCMCEYVVHPPFSSFLPHISLRFPFFFFFFSFLFCDSVDNNRRHPGIFGEERRRCGGGIDEAGGPTISFA